MENTHSEKYLGDVITENGKVGENITARQNKGYGIVSDIL